MHIPIKRVLISVSDKTGIIDFARVLQAQNIEIISTGGTSALLRSHHIAVSDVSDVTGFPEMMDGRVKTLHPKIQGGILGQRDHHAETAQQFGIDWIDLVIVNLYPFKKTIEKADVTRIDAIENIDIGGPTLIRAAAKNMRWVGVIVNPEDYSVVLKELQDEKGLSLKTREELAVKAFQHTAAYDMCIHQYFSETPLKTLQLEKYEDLRYGENPHQKATAYRICEERSGLLQAKCHQGKSLSYNNLLDADAALSCLREFNEAAAVVVKHANPCGVAVGEKAFSRALQADALSAFGGILALNRICDKTTAEAIVKIFLEVLIAPEFTADALEILKTKPNMRVLAYSADTASSWTLKSIDGGVLIQEKDHFIISESDLKVVTKKTLQDKDIQNLLFAWRVIKHVKSNAIVIAKDNVTIGIGAGQVSRVDAVDIAIKKSQANLTGAVLASDAFFPFRDSIDRLKNTGIHAIIQPGGSVRDQEVIDACDEHGIAMVFTGVRCFMH